MIALVALLVGVCIGCALGITLLRDAIDGLWTWPSRPVRRDPLPRMWVESMGHLNRATVLRRRERIIDV